METEIKPYCILVIEDNPGDYMLLQQYFQLGNLPVEKMVLAETMAEATAVVNEGHFDIALLDLTLPDSSGLDSVKTLISHFPDTPIIVLSGLPTLEIATESISLGVQDYLVKGEYDEKLLTKSIQYSIERKKTSERVKQSEETFRRVFEESADSILLLDDTGFTDCNQSAVSILGYSSREEVINKKPWEISPKRQPDGRPSNEKAIEMIAKALQYGFNRFEWVHLKADGTEFYVEVMLTSIILRGKPFFYTVWRDITERKKAEQKLKESLKRYELVNKATHDTIWEWNLENNEITRNFIFSNLYGYSKDEIVNSHDWLIQNIHPMDKERVQKNIKDCIKNKTENWQDEYRFLAADGTYRYVYDRAFVLFDENGNPSHMIGAMSDLTEKKKLQNELVEQQIRQQKELLEVNILAHEEEKNELGRELHDNINQMLATIKMYLGMAKSGHGSPDDDLVGKSYDYLNDTMNELRKLSHSLVTPSLGDIGLKEALQELVSETNLARALKIKLEYDKHLKARDIDKNKELMIYRIVQEQLNNIIKHAKAINVVITIKKEAAKLVLFITDDGAGFETSKKTNGIGLHNISNRVESYSGTMNILSAPGKGCILKIEIPLEK